MSIPEYRAAIIGAGASGTLLAAHWRTVAPPDARVALVEAGARAARGLAYGTPYGAHLLNVAASRMSAFTDDPDHFLRWLQQLVPSAGGGTFAPRALYGEYLAHVLQNGGPSSIARIAGTAVGITREDDRWIVHLHDSRTIRASAVVLALGNLPPADPCGGTDVGPPHYLRDPWAPGAAVGLQRDAEVLLIGTGLTMVDIALSLRAEGHRGTLHALSRHGRLPQTHAPATPRTLTLPDDVDSPRRALRWLREQIGGDWRPVIDALRPLTPTIWRRWSIAQRASFLRHAKNVWDVHRHRMAPEVARRLGETPLVIHAGRIEEMRQTSAGVEVTWRDRGTGESRTMSFARVINCTGPASNYARVELPLVVQMRQAGWLNPDPLGLGVETDDDGALVGPDGARVNGLFTLGPLRRPALWESTAIPEIRQQAADLARHLSALTR